MTKNLFAGAVLLVVATAAATAAIMMLWLGQRRPESSTPLEPQARSSAGEDGSLQEPETRQSQAVRPAPAPALESGGETGIAARPLDRLPDIPARTIAGTAPRFSPNQGTGRLYHVKSVVKHSGGAVSFRGQFRFQCLNKPAIEALPAPLREMIGKGEADGNGTGFLVHPDGLVVTCLHVVGGVDEVTVDFGGKELAGTVIHRDPQHDLALVRIDVHDAPYFRLCLGQPRLGQVARVFGYPLTDRLGRSLKLTTGTVSGRDQVGAGRRIQLDAIANPGNSGGPVTNDRGEVMGVVDSIMTGEEVASVSFAVPADDLAAVLDSLAVPFCSASSPPPPGAVADLEQAEAAVVLISVSGEKKLGNMLAVSYGGLQIREPLAAGPIDDPIEALRRGLAAAGNSQDIRGTLVIDPRGQIIHSGEMAFWPGTPLNVAELALPRFPWGMEPEWEDSEKMIMELQSGRGNDNRTGNPMLDLLMGDDRGRFGPRNLPGPFGPFGPFGGFDPPEPRPSVQLARGERKLKYRLADRGSSWKFGLIADLEIRSLPAETKVQTIHLEGEYTIEPESGWVESFTGRGFVEKTEQGRLVRTESETSIQRLADPQGAAAGQAAPQRTITVQIGNEPPRVIVFPPENGSAPPSGAAASTGTGSRPPGPDDWERAVKAVQSPALDKFNPDQNP